MCGLAPEKGATPCCGMMYAGGGPRGAEPAWKLLGPYDGGSPERMGSIALTLGGIIPGGGTPGGSVETLCGVVKGAWPRMGSVGRCCTRGRP